MKNNLEIIKKSFKFTFKNYKHLILVIVILYLSKLIINEISHVLSPNLYIMFFLINLIILGLTIGFSYSVVSNLIKNDRSVPKITIHHVTNGLKDYTLDFYYMILSVITSIIILSPVIVYHFSLINKIIEFSEDFQFNFSKYTLSLLHQYDLSIFLATFVFAVIFMTFFAILMIAKIHYADEGNFIDAFNLFLIFRKVRKMGYAEFFKIILFMSLVLFMLSFIMNYLQKFVDTELISTIFEAVLLFINLRVFTYIYDDANLEVVKDTSIISI